MNRNSVQVLEEKQKGENQIFIGNEPLVRFIGAQAISARC